MSLARRSRRRGMIAGAAIASSRANKRAAASAATPSDPVPATTQAQSQDMDVDQLKKLAELKDAGILTQDEFDAKKKQILGI